MNLQEFQSRRLLFDEGIASPEGIVATSPGEAEAAFLELAPPAALVKGQTTGIARAEADLIRRCEHPHEVRSAAEEMLIPSPSRSARSGSRR